MQNIVPDSSSRIGGYTTRESHLKRLGEKEEAAWNEFYTKYKAMIYAIGASRKLAEEECEDLMQEVALICSRKLQNFIYDPERCRFRSFLFKITTNVAFNLLRKKNKHQVYCSFWCVKEATVKAFSNRALSFQEINITSTEDGKPYIIKNETIQNELKKLGMSEIKISISNAKNYSTAICLIY